MPQSATTQKHPAPPKSGWSPERRARQAARIRLWAPWARSTGPKTATGKRKSSANSYKHGGRARDMRLISKALSAQSRFLRDVNRYISATKRYPANELLAKYSRRLALEGRMASVMLDYALRAAGFTLEWRSGHYVPRKFHQNR
jgi:hypothetical protein